jgi:hypothetical protein
MKEKIIQIETYKTETGGIFVLALTNEGQIFIYDIEFSKWSLMSFSPDFSKQRLPA